MEELLQIIKEMDIPFAYDHFAEGESRIRRLFVIFPRTATTLLRTGRSTTRSMRFISNCIPTVRTCRQNRKWKLCLMSMAIFYEKSEVWIESEKLYEVLYSFEMEA